MRTLKLGKTLIFIIYSIEGVSNSKIPPNL